MNFDPSVGWGALAKNPWLLAGLSNLANLASTYTQKKLSKFDKGRGIVYTSVSSGNCAARDILF